MKQTSKVLYAMFMFIIVYTIYQILDIETAIIAMFTYIISDLNEININLKNK